MALLDFDIDFNSGFRINFETISLKILLAFYKNLDVWLSKIWCKENCYFKIVK